MLKSPKHFWEAILSDAATLAEPLEGKVRIALNQSDSSIHDPEAARKLGFRGAAVGGNNHLDLFAPLLVETYANQWFERGALSLYFLNVVVFGETVQAVAERPSPAGAQIRVHACGPVFLDSPYEVEGRVVGFGDSPKTEYQRWDATARDGHGETVVTMRHLLRFLKSTSPLYAA